MNLNYLKKNCLVLDIETSAHYHGGKEINIRSNFETYVLMAQCKWFGAYSYKYDKYYYINVVKDRSTVYNLLQEHKFLIGFNNEDFDNRILVNNNLMSEDDKHMTVDCMTILGQSKYKNSSGYAYKNKGELMDFHFKKNSLKHMAEVMGVETQKGDIDYKIFHKNEWTPDEEKEIIKYLEGDIKSNKEIFEKVWDYWIPFTELLYENDIKNLSWIRASIASLIYKSACYLLGIKPEYGESGSFEDMGGRVIDPQLEEKEGVWYIDFASLYPHIFCMFNLFSEVDRSDGWHGNKLFEVRGYYDISEQHKLSKAVQEKLKQREELKKNDPDNPMIYTLKIWLNGLYGVMRSPIFKQIHTPNCGWDCCWLGQQIQKFTEDKMKEFGFETIYGDTDSLMVYAKNKNFNNTEYVKQCLSKIIKEIFDNVPFPVETFKIDIEKYLDYIMFPFSDQPIQDENGKNVKIKNRLVKERKGKKKNYLYTYTEDKESKVKLVGLPLIKDNATHLGMTIYKDILKKEILETNSAKFDRERINNIIAEYLERPDVMDSISIEYKVKPSRTYKNQNGIHAQISSHYFSEGDGVVKLIKNKKIGEVGKGAKYCTVKEALDNNLTIDDLDLEKLYNELEPFIKYEVKKEVMT